ncbi:MAG: DUF488 domain-containing protein [Desulfurococcales archaeon]|nr:DUF488 domain-containing protein [Desulfurococcales archaeon]
MAVIYTLGHSTRRLGEVLRILRRAGATTVVDVRRWPSSRRSPWFSRESLERALPAEGIKYVWLGEELGGYRRLGRDVPEGVPLPDCYESEGFKAYAAYILTSPRAQRALGLIEDLARRSPVVILCSEKLPWRCHRKIIAEVLSHRGHRVVHIIDEDRLVPHKPSECMKKYIEKMGGRGG